MVSWQHGDKDTVILNDVESSLTNLGFLLGFFGSMGISNILYGEIQTMATGVN